MLTTTTNKNITFNGIKPDLRLAEKVLREVKKEYPAVSSTMVDFKMHALKDSNYLDRYPRLKHGWRLLSQEIYHKIYELRKTREMYGLENYIKSTKTLVKEERVAECGELVTLVYDTLHRLGKSPKLVHFKIKPQQGFKPKDRSYDDHSFIVFGLKKGANLCKPETWGNKAIIIAPWSGISGKANDVIRYWQTKFIKPAEEFIKFVHAKNGNKILEMSAGK